jgi:hypothetical protein
MAPGHDPPHALVPFEMAFDAVPARQVPVFQLVTNWWSDLIVVKEGHPQRRDGRGARTRQRPWLRDAVLFDVTAAQMVARSPPTRRARGAAGVLSRDDATLTEEAIEATGCVPAVEALRSAALTAAD